MTETESKKRSRLRWVTLGEGIAIAALILSGLGLWHEWNKNDSRIAAAAQAAPIPLVLRGEEKNEGRKLEISPIEDSHELQSATVSLAGHKIALESDGDLDADEVKAALGGAIQDGGPHRVPVRITARYVEAGKEKTATGSYQLTYRTKDKLIGGRSLRLVGLSR